MDRNLNIFIIASTPILCLLFYFLGMNWYVRRAVKRRIRELEIFACNTSPVNFDWNRWHDEMTECKEWLAHGWPEPGCLYQGPIIGKYGFEYVKPKKYVKF